MRTIAITGAGGFLAWHLRCHLHGQGWASPLLLDHVAWGDAEGRRGVLQRADAVVHLAGINRAKPGEVEEGNIRIAQQLVDSLERTGRTPDLIYTSSTHAEHDTPYGRGKRRAGEILGEWADRVGAKFTTFVLPHVFGEQCRPFYNSVAATFCYQIAKGEAPRVDVNGQLELVHAQDVCAAIVETLLQPAGGLRRLHGRPVTVVELLEQVQALDADYRNDIVPDLRDDFTLRLFNTYRGYLYPEHYPVGLKLNTDNRGGLFEAVKGYSGGQAFLSTTKPGITRGEHYHFNKVERFLVIGGSAVIRIRKLFSREVSEFRVSGSEPRYIDMPTLHTHNITNTGSDTLLTMFWSNEIFDSARPDTVREPVNQQG